MTSVYLTPRGLLKDPSARDALAAAWAWPMPGGAFTALTASIRGEAFEHRLVSRPRYYGLWPDHKRDLDRQLNAMAALRPEFAGVSLTQPVVMGVVNVTPDSFSDGGVSATVATAIARGVALAEAGAAIIDVGGESTRPGAAPVAADAEIARTRDVVKALAERGLTVSVDTRKPPVMAAALAAGARIVNDITALAAPEALQIVAGSNAGVVLMHMQGEPRTMQDAPAYAWAPGDIHDFLRARIEACTAAGIGLERIAVDPGIGFGKTAAHNADILDHLAMFHGLGCAVALGGSRKSFIGHVSRNESTDARLPGSIALALHAAGQGIQILRVHDVAETRQALAVWAKTG